MAKNNEKLSDPKACIDRVHDYLHQLGITFRYENWESCVIGMATWYWDNDMGWADYIYGLDKSNKEVWRVDSYYKPQLYPIALNLYQFYKLNKV